MPRINLKSVSFFSRLRFLPSPLLLVSIIIAARAIAVSQPKARPDTPIDDLSVPAEQILALSPDVAKIEVLLWAPRPTYRIIQIADCHYFGREDYRRSNLRILGQRSEEGYSQYASEVQNLQDAQLRLLCWLVDDHSLREVFLEGVYDEVLSNADTGLEARRRWRERKSGVATRASSLRRQINEAEAQGNEATGLRERNCEAEMYLGWGLSQGCGWDLPVVRPCVRLLPAEDRNVYQRSHLRRLGSPEMDDREEAIVRNLLARRGCAVVVLGGGHNLSKQIKRLVGSRCEYVRVTPKGYPRPVVRDGRIAWVSK